MISLSTTPSSRRSRRANRERGAALPEVHAVKFKLPRGRPSFRALVKSIRKAGGDRRSYVERRGVLSKDDLTFKFNDYRKYKAALTAALQFLPVAFEQYTHDDRRMEMTVSLRACGFCGLKFDEHVPPHNQCLFAATRFQERNDG